MSLRRRALAAFDMDNTINTVFLEGAIFSKINSLVRDKYIKGKKPWQERVMNALSKHNYNIDEVTNHIKKIGLVPGMKQMFQNLKKNDVQVIILSGGSDLFVKIYLEQHGLLDCFTSIIANKMQESGGHLMYRPVAKLTPCIPECKNYLCKKHYLSQYVKDKNFDKIFMVGDGQNDFCACCWIKQGGAMIRSPSQLIDEFKSHPSMRSKISCPIYEWSDGHSLNQQFQRALSE